MVEVTRHGFVGAGQFRVLRGCSLHKLKHQFTLTLFPAPLQAAPSAPTRPLPVHPMSLLVDCLSGAIAGVSGTLLGHPLDTIRVKLQAGQGKSALAVSRELSREGVLGFYRGFLPPLLTVGIASTLAFSTNEVAKRALLPERREGWRYYSGLVGSGEGAAPAARALGHGGRATLGLSRWAFLPLPAFSFSVELGARLPAPMPMPWPGARCLTHQ